MGGNACRACTEDPHQVVDNNNQSAVSSEAPPVDGFSSAAGGATANGADRVHAHQAVAGATGPSKESDNSGEFYTITLDRSSGLKLGIDVDAFEENVTLPIIAVTGGLVEQWNTQNPQSVVREGDHIEEVNGARGSVSALMERCKNDTVMKMKLKKKEFCPDH